jgi:hypothetical protein
VVGDSDPLKGWMSASVPVFTEAHKVNQLLRVKELKIISATLDDLSFKFKGALYARRATLLNLGNVCFIPPLKPFRLGVTRNCKLSNFVDQIENHSDPCTNDCCSVSTGLVTPDCFCDVALRLLGTTTRGRCFNIGKTFDHSTSFAEKA